MHPVKNGGITVLDIDATSYAANTDIMLSDFDVGTGTDVTIAELARIIADVTGFQGRINFDSTTPDGTPRKMLDVSRLGRMGWRAKTGFTSGVAETYRWFLEHASGLREA